MAQEKETKKEPRLLALKYVLSLISGSVAVGLLLALIGAVTYHLIAPTDQISAYAFENGQAFVGVIASLLVFGLMYIITTYMSGNLRTANKNHLYMKVLSIVFASILAIPAVIFLIMAIVPLVGFGVGTAAVDTSGSIAQIVFSFIAFFVFAVMITYHLGLRCCCKRLSYIAVSAIVTIAAIALYMIFPGADVRNAASDQKIINDLSKISAAIDRYTDNNGQLPASLDDLGTAPKLNRDLGSYEFNIKSQPSDSSRYAKYELCTDGFKVDTTNARTARSIYSSSFSSHSSGRQCFSLSNYTYTSSYTSNATLESTDYWRDY